MVATSPSSRLGDPPFSLTLVHPGPTLCEAWERAFARWIGQGVTVHRGRYQEVAGDGLVSPANSYGRMDGGLDAVIAEHLPRVQRSVSDHLAEHFSGYQPVGTACVVPTYAPDLPWLVHAPTMRVPTVLTGELQLNVHDALWAALHAAEEHGGITHLVCPGLGAGVGRVPAEDVAGLMAFAYTGWRTGQGRSYSTDFAWAHHRRLLEA